MCRLLGVLGCLCCLCLVPLPAWADGAAHLSVDAASTTPPRPVSELSAPYPSSAPAAAKATVHVRARIDHDGRVADVTVLESGGEPFDAAALEAVRGAAFAPATREGQPVDAVLEITFDFAPVAETP